MKLVRYTLLADGTSDVVLMPIIDWLMMLHLPGVSISGAFARDIGKVGRDLSVRAAAAAKDFPCDILIVHRDAEGESLATRQAEIAAAARGSEALYIPLVPVKMTESWLLSDEVAIRFAAGNLNGKIKLSIPDRKTWERLPDAKETLFELLRTASESKGRSLKKFSVESARFLITRRSENFEKLRGIPSFDAFEKTLTQHLKKFI